MFSGIALPLSLLQNVPLPPSHQINAPRTHIVKICVNQLPADRNAKESAILNAIVVSCACSNQGCFGHGTKLQSKKTREPAKTSAVGILRNYKQPLSGTQKVTSGKHSCLSDIKRYFWLLLPLRWGVKQFLCCLRQKNHNQDVELISRIGGDLKTAFPSLRQTKTKIYTEMWRGVGLLTETHQSFAASVHIHSTQVAKPVHNQKIGASQTFVSVWEFGIAKLFLLRLKRTDALRLARHFEGWPSDSNPGLRCNRSLVPESQIICGIMKQQTAGRTPLPSVWCMGPWQWYSHPSLIGTLDSLSMKR